MSGEMKLGEDIEETAEKLTPPRQNLWREYTLRNLWPEYTEETAEKLTPLRDVRSLFGKMIMGFQDEPSIYFVGSNLRNEPELEQGSAEYNDKKSFNRVRKNGKMSNRNKNNQQVSMDTVQSISSFLIYIIVFLGISYIIWSSQLSIINVHPMNKEHDHRLSVCPPNLSIINVHPIKEHEHRLSVWPPLLGLFGYMVFVCAVAAMNLVGAAFTTMHKTMIIFWATLMNLQLANSNTEVFVTLACGFFMECYMLLERKTTTK